MRGAFDEPAYHPSSPERAGHPAHARALEVTEDLAVVQDLLGHASPATTRVYARVTSKRLHEAHQRIFGYAADRDEG